MKTNEKLILYLVMLIVFSSSVFAQANKYFELVVNDDIMANDELQSMVSRDRAAHYGGLKSLKQTLRVDYAGAGNPNNPGAGPGEYIVETIDRSGQVVGTSPAKAERFKLVRKDARHFYYDCGQLTLEKAIGVPPGGKLRLRYSFSPRNGADPVKTKVWVTATARFKRAKH